MSSSKKNEGATSTNVPKGQDHHMILEALNFIETLTSHELALIGNRMTWFVVSQAFLFGAYVTIATDPVRLQHAFTIGQAVENRPVGANTITWLLFITPIIGMAISVAGWLSVKAATTVQGTLEQTRGDLIVEYNKILKLNNIKEIPVIGTYKHRYDSGEGKNVKLANTVFWGRLPEWLLPWGMTLAWAAALALRIKSFGVQFGAP